MKNLTDQQIIDSWKSNVKPWISAIRDGEIESRLAVTNQAIIDAVLSGTPKTVLDVGCGEGWLVRELSKAGVDTMGIDGVADLIAYAQQQSDDRFETLAFEDLSNANIKQQFDVIVANFSLLGKESVECLFGNIANLLNAEGTFIVQTIHPISASSKSAEARYQDGWREGSWAGFNPAFCNPAPWYFRTLTSWEKLFAEYDLTLVEQLTPQHPQTQQPASIIFISTPVNC